MKNTNKETVYHLRACNFQNLPDEIKSFLTESFPLRHVEASYQVTTGLSNQNYLVVVEQNQYLVKLYQCDIPVPSLTFQSLIAPRVRHVQKVIAWDESRKVALFDYVDELAWGMDNKRLCDLVETIAQVHQHALDDLSVSLDIKQALAGLRGSFKQRFHSELQFCASVLDRYPEQLGCCHNDLVKENIILTEAGVVVIDFEYAAVGDVYFDLAAIATSCCVNDEEIVWMLNSYYRHIKSDIPNFAKDKLMVFRVTYLLLCIAWYEERGEAKKAASHIEQLKKISAI